MRRLELVSVLCAQGLLLAFAGCSQSPAEQVVEVTAAQGGTPEIRTIDDCDPSDFAGLCNPAFNGDTTLPEFLAELSARKSVGAWKLSSAVNVDAGRNVNAVSRGGETHTVTVVANFGGGKVQPLNDASGNPVPAPECLQAENPRNLTIASGTTKTITTGARGTLPPGHYKVQCCIHPWMRSEIDVR
jgi:plastocyanin